MKYEDIVVGKKYKINKPDDVDEYPYWEVDMDHLEGEVVTAGTIIREETGRYVIKHGVWKLNINWLSAVDDEESLATEPTIGKLTTTTKHTHSFTYAEVNQILKEYLGWEDKEKVTVSRSVWADDGNVETISVSYEENKDED